MVEEMDRDDRVFLMGEEVGHYQGAYKVSEGMLDKFGPKRVVDTPIAEAGFAGVGVGAAMVGLRPIIEFMTWNFSAVAFDQILNNAAKLRQMSGGQFECPIVFRGPNASAAQVGSQHSHAMEHFYATIPGLKVVAPAFPADAKGLLKAAIRDDNPVLVMESETLYGVRGEVPDGENVVAMGKAQIARAGKDVTIAAYSRMTHVALDAAAALEKEGVSAEVVDLRSLRPLDGSLRLRRCQRTVGCRQQQFCFLGGPAMSPLDISYGLVGLGQRLGGQPGSQQRVAAVQAETRGWHVQRAIAVASLIKEGKRRR